MKNSPRPRGFQILLVIWCFDDGGGV
uniref:Uncharacterized protein n=1 Tax=Anguilla anguilla TaxID=7936 RepID=A0A0E9U670_ANGAN